MRVKIAILVFVASLLFSQVVSTAVGKSVYVDSVKGNDATAVISDTDRPFLTVSAAIAAAHTQHPGPGNVWEIFLATGIYVGDVVLPDSIYLTGTGPGCLIIGTIIHTGGTLVTSVLIVSTDAPGIIGNTSQDVNYLNSVVSTTYTQPSLNPISTVHMLQGEFGFSLGAMFSSYKSSAPAAYMIQSPNAGIVLQSVELRMTVSGSIPNITFYRVGGSDKAEITNGVTALTLVNPAEQVVVFDNDGLTHSTIFSNRIDVQGNTLNPHATYRLFVLRGAAVTDLISSQVSFTGIGSAEIILAEGISVAGVSPSFGMEGGVILDSVVPPTIGSFARQRITTTDSYGSLKVSGGIYLNIITVHGDYTAESDDYTIVVERSPSIITLPTYRGVRGRVIHVINSSEAHITVRTAQGDRSLRSESSRTFQHTGTRWIDL